VTQIQCYFRSCR